MPFIFRNFYRNLYIFMSMQAIFTQILHRKPHTQILQLESRNHFEHFILEGDRKYFLIQFVVWSPSCLCD